MKLNQTITLFIILLSFFTLNNVRQKVESSIGVEAIEAKVSNGLDQISCIIGNEQSEERFDDFGASTKIQTKLIVLTQSIKENILNKILR